MKSKLGISLMVLGALLILGAVSLFLFNEYEASQAEQATDVLLPQLQDLIKERQSNAGSVTTAPPPTADPDVTTAPSDTTPDGTTGFPTLPEVPITPSDVYEPSTEMAEVEMDGYAYIGYISMPSLDLELPIMSEWDYKRLKVAPCRYTGSVNGDDLVLLAHNYTKHFGKIRRLTAGDIVSFTDVDGVTTHYEVISLVTLQPTDVEKVTASGYDLTLFTCTYGGSTRVTVYCDKLS